jgi:dihydrofolate reductase
LEQARAVPGDAHIAIAGGASTVNQFQVAGLLDELRLHITPFTVGAGTRIFDGAPPLRLEQVASRPVPSRPAGHPRDLPPRPLTGTSTEVTPAV